MKKFDVLIILLITYTHPVFSEYEIINVPKEDQGLCILGIPECEEECLENRKIFEALEKCNADKKKSTRCESERKSNTESGKKLFECIAKGLEKIREKKRTKN